MPAQDDYRILAAFAKHAASVDDAEARAMLRADPTIPPEIKRRLERFFSLIDAERAQAGAKL